jgi:membrane associated rhomboid family serine protease
MYDDLTMLRPGPARALQHFVALPWMTWLLTGTILLVWVVQFFGIRHGIDVVGTSLAVGPEALAQHRYWTLLTYAWAHAQPLAGLPLYAGFHLATNVVPLFCIGPAVERRCGPWWVLAVFAGGAIASALAWIAWHPGPQAAMIGASGALFALIAAGGVMGVHLWRVDLVFFQIPLRLDLRLAAVVLCLIELGQMFLHGLPDVAHVAHLGGALFGVACGLFMPRHAR